MSKRKGRFSLDRVIELQKLLLNFNNLERTLLLPSILGKADRNESDTEHSYSLAMIAWYLAQSMHNLDANRCLRYALVHDLVELHAGDTFAYDKNQSVHESQPIREKRAVAKLKQAWPDFAEMNEAIAGYEARDDAESRFVYALDKLMPMVINHLSGGKNYRAHDVKLEDVRRAKDKKVAVSPEIDALYQELIALFESRPDYFA